MKVLMVHKFYYIEGGAERYMFNLSHLLQQNGDEVIPFAMKHPRNEPSPYERYFVEHFEPDRELAKLGPINGLKAAGRVIYNRQAQRQIEALIDEVKPDVAHVHGVYHHLSPSVLWALKRKKVPIVFTLHEYKILCPAYLFLDGQGAVCELCAGKHFWHPVAKKCFRNSLPASLLVSVESYVHRFLKTYHKTVDLYLSPSRFLLGKMIQYGYPEAKVQWLPYTIPIEFYQPFYDHEGYFVYVGRLSAEKGIRELIRAMKQIPQAHLKVVGGGRLEEELKSFVAQNAMRNVEFMGYRQGDELREIVRRAMFVAVPSAVYDNSPLSIYEAFAHGKPVVGAAIGGIPELIDEGEDGFLFEVGDEAGMIASIEKMLAQKDQLAQMGKRAREKAETLFSPQVHYERITFIYDSVIKSSKRRRSRE